MSSTYLGGGLARNQVGERHLSDVTSYTPYTLLQVSFTHFEDLPKGGTPTLKLLRLFHLLSRYAKALTIANVKLCFSANVGYDLGGLREA